MSARADRLRRIAGDAVGAFADGAILFPILGVLLVRTNFSSVALLGSAGLAYLVAGLVFRVPMSVQPLKSIAIASVAIGASAAEIRLSAAALGVVALAVSFLDVNRLAEKVPRALVHGLQLGLGVLLLIQGSKFALAQSSPWLWFGAALGLVAFSSLSRFPLLGLLAFGGLAWALFFDTSAAPGDVAVVSLGQDSGLRPWIILSLVLPQLALTASNSVVGTIDVSQRYFGRRAGRVTARRLLQLIGFGNLFTSAVGGLPFCHGSGGVTAHVRGGATSWLMNVIMGGALLVFAAAQHFGLAFDLNYPKWLAATLLLATGVFHLQLAAPSWRSDRRTLIAMGLAGLLSQNMLWILVTGTLVFWLDNKRVLSRLGVLRRLG